MGRVPAPLKDFLDKRDYLRSILKPQPKADSPQVEANLKASCRNWGGNVRLR
jgi:hypothetical protein